MKVALDCNALIHWSAGRDSDDGARVEALFSDCDGLVVPMPALAEFLVGKRGDDQEWIEALARKSRIKLAEFGRRAAYECAQIDAQLRSAMPGGGKRRGSREDAWQKVKFDRQILSIAIVEGCELLVARDSSLAKTAQTLKIRVMAVPELPLPPSAAQRRLDLDLETAAALPLPKPTLPDQ